jgi:hypothetical protein
LADDTTVTVVTSGSFSSTLTNLQPSTLYHVRAYAINSAGVGYGNVVDFTTGNAAPTATNIVIAGGSTVGDLLTAHYVYSDVEDDMEEGTTFQWYISPEATGAGETAIEGATDSTYIIAPTDEFKYIRVGITAKAATGNMEGSEIKSDFIGPVPTYEKVTFSYNGQTVTYGVITSTATGKKWLDRNIGATRKAIAYDDYQAFGDLFQWGRGADGHQLVSRTAVSTFTPVNGGTDALSTGDVPGHNLFITNPPITYPADWRATPNDNLWQPPVYINNPCPTGWHIPSRAEWEAENITSLLVGFDKLKLTAAGWRRFDSEQQPLAAAPGYVGFYWSSSTYPPLVLGEYYRLYPTNSGSDNAILATDQRGDARSCRCTKN